MGLDVYLKEAQVVEAENAKEVEWECRFDAEWQRAAAAVASEQGLPMTVVTAEKSDVIRERLDRSTFPKLSYERVPDKPSEKYPEHRFKRTYLRSSYSSAGFDQVMQRFGLSTLGAIFAPAGSGDEPGLTPTPAQLNECRQRAVALVEALQKKMAEPLFDVVEVSFNAFMGKGQMRDATDAIEIVKQEFARRAGHGTNSYSSAAGDFWLDGLEIVAAIPAESLLGTPSFNLVYRKRQEDALWYLQAAEIVVEFIDEALGMERPYISWSG